MGGEGVRRAHLGDAAALADLAAETFPMACPPELPEADVASFIAQHLSPARFAEYLADPSHVVAVYERAGVLVGYALLMLDQRPEEAFGVRCHPAAFLSKLYVRASSHGGVVAGALLDAVRCAAAERGAASIWLNTNQGNARACRFYEKHGFRVVGTKTMQVGGQLCQDYVFELVLSATGEESVRD